MAKVLVRDDGPVRVLTLNRPEVHNCVDGETATHLAEAIQAFAADAGAHVLVITGAGQKAFCSGADLKNLTSLLGHDWVERAGPMGFARLDPGKPTLAAVNGYCFAGGLELAAWCDFRIAAANAEFGALNRRWGVPFADGGTLRFARIVGQGNALWLVETGVRIDAQRALAIGLVQEVVATGQALARALEVARRVAEYPQASLRADRTATLATWGLSLAEGLRLEAETCLPTAGDPEMAKGLARFTGPDRPEAPRPT
ncbi:MAG TPA: enoyl-CoA hydratase-related protein [Methylomirabilota bacterium]|nr:enoyl-CoA hydratase-related protein [Methylomirabilota bacterium]